MLPVETLLTVYEMTCKTHKLVVINLYCINKVLSCLTNCFRLTYAPNICAIIIVHVRVCVKEIRK